MAKRFFVDLFAGCGGLSLGLEHNGFVPVYVSEVNKDAMETYLINRDDANPLLREKHHDTDIRQLTHKSGRLQSLVKEFRSDYGIAKGELDLVVGGPPCQGFSIIGHRRSFTVQKKELPYNYLYRDMVKTIKHLAPKCFLFENVGGILSGRWGPNGNNGEIWNDVQKSFERLDYTIHWQLIHAKMYGVPQNRPRVIMIGMRNDTSYDVDEDLPAKGFLPEYTYDWAGPKELLSDLIDPNYLDKDATITYLKNPRTAIQKKLRGNLKKGDPLTDHQYSKHSKAMIEKFTYMIKHDGMIPKKYQTKKFYQKVLPEKWGNAGPNVTMASNPVDHIHYLQPRTLTVREYARFQMFPDWYVFTGNRHTGGRRRAGDPDKGIWDREVPKYTQIGNAVPVKLAEIIGKHLFKIMM